MVTLQLYLKESGLERVKARSFHTCSIGHVVLE